MIGCQSMNNLPDTVPWTGQKVSRSAASLLCQKVVLLSLAESEGPSDFTRGAPLVPMSSPCN